MKYDSVGGRSRRLIDLVVVIVVRTIRKKSSRGCLCNIVEICA